jgi:hypothetical protein
MTWFFLFYVVLAAFVFAKLEIQIEGKDGWAKNLPTWRIEKHVLLDWFYGGRPFTGYHFWAFAYVFLTFHLPFFWMGDWTWRWELKAIGGYALFWVLEDFLWFVPPNVLGLKHLPTKMGIQNKPKKIL